MDVSPSFGRFMNSFVNRFNHTLNWEVFDKKRLTFGNDTRWKKTQETLELVQQKQNDFAGGRLPLPGHVVPRGHLVEFYCWSKGVELVSPINARFWWVPPSLLLHLKSKWCLNQGLKNSKLPWEKWVISDHQAAQRLRASNKFFMHEVFDRPQVLGRLGGEAAGFATAIRVPGPAATHHQTVGWPSNGCRGIHPIIFTIP